MIQVKLLQSGRPRYGIDEAGRRMQVNLSEQRTVFEMYSRRSTMSSVDHTRTNEKWETVLFCGGIVVGLDAMPLDDAESGRCRNRRDCRGRSTEAG